jgi:hypothetical protein
VPSSNVKRKQADDQLHRNLSTDVTNGGVSMSMKSSVAPAVS